MIRGFKGATTKQINQYIDNSEGGSIWQSRFYDRIINTDEELENVCSFLSGSKQFHITITRDIDEVKNKKYEFTI